MSRRSFIRNAMAAVALTCSGLRLAHSGIEMNLPKGRVVADNYTSTMFIGKPHRWVLVDNMDNLP